MGDVEGADVAGKLIKSLVTESDGRDRAARRRAVERRVDEPEPVLDLRGNLSRNPGDGDGVCDDSPDGGGADSGVFGDVLDGSDTVE